MIKVQLFFQKNLYNHNLHNLNKNKCTVILLSSQHEIHCKIFYDLWLISIPIWSKCNYSSKRHHKLNKNKYTVILFSLQHEIHCKISFELWFKVIQYMFKVEIIVLLRDTNNFEI